MPSMNQDSLFDQAGQPRVHARSTDPVSSELTLRSLGRDTSYNWRIFTAIMTESERNELRHYDDGDSIAVIYDKPVTDDMIQRYMEQHCGRRFQRNVIARQRGIIRELGWIKRVDDVLGFDVDGIRVRQVVAHVPTQEGIDAWNSR